MNIKIVSNFQFEDLYNISRSFYDKLPYEKVTVNGRGGFYGYEFLRLRAGILPISMGR